MTSILLLSLGIGCLIMIIIDVLFFRIYGYPSMSILMAYCYKSKRWKWVVYNVWGNVDWYWKRIIKENKL